MIIRDEFVGAEAREVGGFEPPFGPGYDAELCAKIARLVILDSEDDDPESYIEFRAYDHAGLPFAIRKVLRIDQT